ncbi:MAG: carboxypeptidase regulatory-like domain-containing protein [Bacteroidota bacterium]
MKRITLLLSLFLIALFTYGQSYYQHPEDLEKLTAQREAAVEKIVQQTPVELKADPMDLSRTGTCPDGTFMSNSPDGGTAYTSSTDADLTNYQYYSGADMIGGISFWALQGFFDGVAWAECTSDPMDIQIKFYEDNNGEPGTELHSETVSISPVPDPDVTFGDWTVKSFMAYLSDPVALPSGWFSVSSTNNPTCWILAINSESGTGANGYYDEGVWTPREFPQNYCFLAPLADDNAPAAPTDLTVTAAEMGELEATLAWTNPALTFSGETLTELTEINIVRDGTVIHTIDDPVIGATDSYTDNTVTEAGNYSYAVYGVNTAGDGPAVTASTYIGEDVPAAPADVTLVAVGNDGELSWTAPTEGLNGGYLSGDGITYTIVRMPGNVEVATDVTETEFLDNTVPGIGNYSYTVTASNAIGTGGSATSNTVLLGAEGILLYETFDYEIGTIPPDWFVEAELDPDGNNQGDGMENWGVNNSSSAGGTAPQMRFNWSPRFEGMSRLVTGAIDTEGNEQLRLKFRQYLSNFSVVENTLAVRVTFDGGETFETIWEHLITGNIPAEMAELYIDIPAGKETFHIAWEFNGDAYQINQWFIDDVILEPVLENDLVAMSVSGNTTPSEGMETVYTVNIQNAGTLTQSSYNVKLMQEGGVELASVAGNAIAFGETQAYELAWTPPPGSLGETFIYGYVELAGDEVPGNNQTENLDLVIQSSDILAVTIGDGELMTTQPYNMVYDYSLQQTLYYPDEIDTGGGVITGIQYVNNFDVDWPQRHIQIWLGETELENLADGWVDPSSLQLVFDGMVDFPAGENNIFIPFDDIYIYGGGNLVIYNYKMDEEWEGGKNFYNTDDPESSRTRRAQQDNDPYDPANPPTGTVTHSFPNITMFFSTAGLGALEGNVTDGTDPIEGVMMKVLGTNSSTLTDADGNYEFPYLLPETYNVEFSKFGYETVVVEGVIIEEEATTVQDAALTAIPQFTVSGNVEGNDGVLQEGAMVTLEGYDSYSATTDAEGNFTIEGVYEGTYTITVSAVGYEEYMDEALIVDQDLNLDIEVIEIIVTPFGVMVDVDNQEEGNALLMWNTGEPYFADSFEEGNLDAWYSFIQGDGTPGETGMAYWHTADYDTAPDGAKIARADWGYNIDTWLISPMIIVDDQSSVIFNWNSSYHWSVDPNPNAELMIKVSTDGGNTWEELWNW